MIIYIIIILFVLLCLIWKAYVKIKYKFWSNMPVNHNYNLINYITPYGIIDNEKPKLDKWCNLNKITVIKYNQLTEKQKTSFTNFIQKYYMQSDKVKFVPKRENILPYLDCHFKPSYVSFYNDIDIENYSCNQNKIIGVFTSRPLYLTLPNNVSLCCHYADYLCVHSDYRNKGIAPELIQTQTYYNRTENIDMQVCLFKRENNATMGIVPLIYYDVYCYDISGWIFELKLPFYNDIIEIKKENFYKIREILKIYIKKNFKCIIIPNIENIEELLNTKNYHIYVIICNDIINGIYFFRNATTLIDGNKTLECISAIDLKDKHELFIYGFLKVIEKQQQNYSNLIIENISHLNYIIEYLKPKYNSKFVNKNGIYLYNYIHGTISENHCFVLD